MYTIDQHVYCVQNFADIYFEGVIGYKLQRGIARDSHVDPNGIQYGPMLYATAADNEGGTSIILIQKKTDRNNSGDNIDVQTQSFVEVINEFRFSASKELIAFRCNYKVYLYQADLSGEFNSINFPDIEVDSIQWLGSDLILLIGKKYLYVVGLSIESAYYEFEDGFIVSNEVDGARIITPSSVQYVSLVPNDVLEFFDTKNESAGHQFFFSICNAELNATTDVYEKLKDNLEPAITQCLKCSQYFRSKDFCSALLETVSKAMFKIQGFSSTEFSDTITKLRTCLFFSC